MLVILINYILFALLSLGAIILLIVLVSEIMEKPSFVEDDERIERINHRLDSLRYSMLNQASLLGADFADDNTTSTSTWGSTVTSGTTTYIPGLSSSCGVMSTSSPCDTSWKKEYEIDFETKVQKHKNIKELNIGAIEQITKK